MLAAGVRAFSHSCGMVGDLLGDGGPGELCRSVLDLAEALRVDEGGSWFYVEIDNGFPFGNVEALLGTIAELRDHLWIGPMRGVAEGERRRYHRPQ